MTSTAIATTISGVDREELEARVTAFLSRPSSRPAWSSGHSASSLS